MAKNISFNLLQFTGEARAALSRRKFPKLRLVAIGAIVAFPTENMPKGCQDDSAKLQRLPADIEEVHIEKLVIYRGGLDLAGSNVRIDAIICKSGGIGPDTDSAVGIYSDVDALHVDADQLHVGAILRGGQGGPCPGITLNANETNIDAIVSKTLRGSAGQRSIVVGNIVVELPETVDPKRKWGPVQIAERPFRSTH